MFMESLVSPAQESSFHTLTVSSAVSSVLSIIGSFYIIGRYWYARRLQAKSHHLDVTKELIHILAFLVRYIGVSSLPVFFLNPGVIGLTWT